ncbi:hypothetical protein N8736_05720 [Gammaproteobacteria bacterium]|nr:hypothetical protein [Gammaproteobacteria bacterium]MDC3228685.1 hypothetical protein [Gammaproteobacteria bacterium]
MIFKKNRYLLHFLVLIILASCSTTSKILIPNSNEILKGNSLKDFEDIYEYQSYSEDDLEKIQRAIDSQKLNQEELKNAKILKRNYQKILFKKEYTLNLSFNQKYSKELIELAYKLNLPVNIFWAERKKISLPENLLSQKVNGFCSSLYEDAISSLKREISKNTDPILIIYSQEYESFIQGLEPKNRNLLKVKYDSSDFQEFSAEILGINSSNKRFKKISNINPNQNINFTPRSRSDYKQIVILLNPQEYKSMIPALRYHGGNRFKYLNFISSLEAINTPLQLLDYEDSWAPVSVYTTSKIQKDEFKSLESYLELGTLNEWLLLQILKQAGVQSARINGVTGMIIYKSGSCAERDIPLNRISTDLFLS